MAGRSRLVVVRGSGERGVEPDVHRELFTARHGERGVLAMENGRRETVFTDFDVTDRTGGKTADSTTTRKP